MKYLAFLALLLCSCETKKKYSIVMYRASGNGSFDVKQMECMDDQEAADDAYLTFRTAQATDSLFALKSGYPETFHYTKYYLYNSHKERIELAPTAKRIAFVERYIKKDMADMILK